MAHTDTNISITIKQLRPETTGYLSIVFERPRNFQYQAGDWLDIRFNSPELPIVRTFSFASSPTEPDIVITFRQGVSSFKKALETVRPGDTMTMVRYGSNDFHLHTRSPGVLIAGGIGIAPFRSLIKEQFDTGQKAQLDLIYLHASDDFPFRHELEAWSPVYQALNSSYINTAGLRRKDRDKLLLPHLGSPDALYYIAGPPGMVDSTQGLLLRQGISLKQVVTDRFDGY